MTFKALLAGAAAVAVSAVSTAAFAQAAPVPPSISYGPALPNVCILNREQVLGASSLGKAIETRLQQLNSQVEAELKAELTAINNEAKTLDSQRATLAPDAFEKRQADLQVRANAFERKRQQRGREMVATQEKALGRFEQEMAPAITGVFQQKQCSILFYRQAVVIANPAMDVTQPVVAALNAKITTFTFERERLDAQPAAAGAAAR
jgi:Skp family chaperone for outer membrane proteins